MLERIFVKDKAYLMLRDWIVRGKLLPREKLRDKELAEQLGVSRTPIREALLRLEEEGLVQTKPNRSTQVSPIDFHDTFNLYSLVWTLEGLALKQSFEWITAKQIDSMTRANERLFQAVEAKKSLLAVEADMDFHSVYIELSQNNELQQVIYKLKQKLKRLELYYFESAKDVHLSYSEHQQILDALQRKDLPRALEAVESNWKASFLRVQPNRNLC